MRSVLSVLVVSASLAAVGCTGSNAVLGPSATNTDQNASASVGLVANAAPLPAEVEFTGTVVAVNPSLKTITIGTQVIQVPDTAEITQGRVTINFAVLKVGDVVKVHATVTGSIAAAREVEVQVPPVTPPVVSDPGTVPTPIPDDDNDADVDDDDTEHRGGDDSSDDEDDDEDDDHGEHDGNHDAGDDHGRRGRR